MSQRRRILKVDPETGEIIAVVMQRPHLPVAPVDHEGFLQIESDADPRLNRLDLKTGEFVRDREPVQEAQESDALEFQQKIAARKARARDALARWPAGQRDSA